MSLENGKYKELTQNEKNEKIQDMDKALTKFMNLVCERHPEFGKNLHVSITSISDLVVRIDKRKTYFEIFHQLDGGMSTYKKLALECYWLLKLRPFWISTEDIHSEKQEITNKIIETFCIFLIVTGLKIKISKEFKKELVYSFRHRDFSKESLMVLFNGLDNETI
jgi:hypothetical protein